jgi:hypothetical protein
MGIPNAVDDDLGDGQYPLCDRRVKEQAVDKTLTDIGERE